MSDLLGLMQKLALLFRKLPKKVSHVQVTSLKCAGLRHFLPAPVLERSFYQQAGFIMKKLEDSCQVLERGCDSFSR